MQHSNDSPSATLLTRNQRLVFSVLEPSRVPVSAYGILAHLRAEGLRSPAQIYRALEKLIAIGKVYRIESLNAFMACRGPHRSRRDILGVQICRACGTVSELSDAAVETAIAEHLETTGFAMASARMEMHGLCHACMSRPPLCEEIAAGTAA